MSTWEAFTPYGGVHLIAVAVCALAIVMLTVAGRSAGPQTEPALRRSWGILALSYWLAHVIWWNWEGLDLLAGLPLHLCDFNGVLAPLALWTTHRWARATLYFWSFTLTLQAFIQPLLSHGPAHLQFWTFWAGHTIIMASAVYDVAVLGFRPQWRDIRPVLLVSLAYVAAVMPIDLVLGANYGFIGHPSPESTIPPLVEAMGPWPQRALILMAVAVVGFMLALLPWRLGRAGVALANERGAVHERSA